MGGVGLEGYQEVWHIGCDGWAWHIKRHRRVSHDRSRGATVVMGAGPQEPIGGREGRGMSDHHWKGTNCH